MVHWPVGRKSTVVLYNGRTEYAEKFGEAAETFTKNGFDFVTFDWRGQGLSDCKTHDRSLCHIDDFIEFQHDANTVFSTLSHLNAPRPFFLIGHSMGGCIALRSLQQGIDVKAVSFAAPMWRIYLNRIFRRVAAVSSTLAIRFGREKSYILGTDQRNYIHFANPGKNLLTSDRSKFKMLKQQLAAYPELSTGGPSYGWLHAAIRECDNLLELEPPPYPAKIFLGTRDRVIDPKAIRIISRRWPQAELQLIPDAQHELMMERKEIRQLFFDQIITFFNSHL